MHARFTVTSYLYRRMFYCRRQLENLQTLPGQQKHKILTAKIIIFNNVALINPLLHYNYFANYFQFHFQDISIILVYYYQALQRLTALKTLHVSAILLATIRHKNTQLKHKYVHNRILIFCEFKNLHQVQNNAVLG